MAGLLIDSSSSVASLSKISLFSTPMTQVAIEKSSWHVVHPVNAVTNTGPYEFHLPRDPFYLDLSRNYIHLKVKIVKANYADLEATSKVGPINLLGKCFFKQVKLFLNSKLAYDSNDLYSYRCFLETELNYEQAVKSGFLTSAGYLLDRPVDKVDADTNTGWGERCEMFKESKVVELMAPLHVDLFHQERFLVNGIDVGLELHRHDDQFVLMSFEAAPRYKLQVLDMRWLVRKVELAKNISMAIESTLLKNSIRYPIRRVEVRAVQIDVGRRDTPTTNVFSGQLPRRMIIGMVASASFHGDYGKSPYRFQHFDAQSIYVTVGGVSYPPIPITMDYEKDMYVEPYVMFHEAMGFTGALRSPWISYDEYKHSHCLYAFDFTPENSDSSHFNLIKDGSVNIQIRFKKVIPAGGVKMICYAEFDNMITIDRFRNVYFDYSA